nr:isochorismatase family protein [Sphingopyxis sp. DBS4]
MDHGPAPDRVVACPLQIIAHRSVAPFSIGGHRPDGCDGLPVRLLTKRSYSAFYGNDFEVLLRRLGRDQILIVGVYTSIGCHCSAIDAFMRDMRDMRAFLVSDATADMEPADHAKGLEVAARLCARVVDTETVSRALEPSPGRDGV